MNVIEEILKSMPTKDAEALGSALGMDTAASDAERAADDWDSDNNCNYSSDGTRLLDSENFPDKVIVRNGTRVICDGVFAFRDYMAEDRRIGEEIPEEERVSFLDKIILPSSVEVIGNGAFRECGWITGIKLPTSLVRICDNAFSGCWELQKITCPARLMCIGDRAFFECFSLGSVHLDNNLRILGSEAFAFCESLREITLPRKLAAVGKDPFLGCRKLRRIFVPEGTGELYSDILPASQHKFIREI